jgi:hypothetical protein
MNEKEFRVDKLGCFEFLVTLLEIDYPRIFVAKIKDKPTIFLFDEIFFDDEKVQWACTQISFLEFDNLNRGMTTIRQCFFGPRSEIKKGFIITSERGREIASSESVNNVSKLIKNDDFYPNEFVKEDHGNGPLSLLFNQSLLSVVLEQNPYSSPMLSVSGLISCLTLGKNMLNSMPFCIDAQNNQTFVSYSHSVVLTFGISDKKDESISPKQCSLIDQSFEETDSAVFAFETIINEASTEKEIIDAFKGKKESIASCVSFIKAIEKNSNNNFAFFQLINSKESKNERKEISKNQIQKIETNARRSIEYIENSNKTSEKLELSGYFIMVDYTGKRSFKFQSNSKQMKIIRGYLSDEFLYRKESIVMKDKIYKATFSKIVFLGEFGKSDPIFYLTTIKEGDTQLSIENS